MWRTANPAYRLAHTTFGLRQRFDLTVFDDLLNGRGFDSLQVGQSANPNAIEFNFTNLVAGA
jgi:hypothetical protein